MAKKGIHPETHNITVKMTDGSSFTTKSCWGKKDDVMKLDIDPKNHPAWQKNKSRFVNVKDDRVSRFNKKFGNFGFGIDSDSKNESTESAEEENSTK